MRMSTMPLDAGGGRRHVIARIADVRLDRAARRRDAKLLRAAEEIVRVEIAAHRWRRCRSAAARRVHSRPDRIGAGALRPDIEEAAASIPRIEPPRRRSCHIECGHVDLPACDHALGDFERGAAFDEGDFGAGAAHSSGDEAAPRILARR